MRPTSNATLKIMNSGIRILTVFVLLFATRAFCQDKDEWTAADSALQTTFVVLALVDWKQTREFSGNPQKYPDMYETNPVLGPHPSARKINIFMGSSIAAHTIIAVLSPKPFRTVWQSFWITVEVHCIHENYKAGVSIHF